MIIPPYNSVDVFKPDGIQWNLKMVNASSFWEYSRGNKKVVALIDSGLDINHTELAENIINPLNYTGGNKNDVMDNNGHGTHVAGLIAGKDIGVAPEARIMPLKVAGENPRQTSTFIEAALKDIMEWNEKCSVNDRVIAVNFSYQSKQYNEKIAYLLKILNSTGVVICAAAGNSSQNISDSDEVFAYPAFQSDVVSVSSVNRNGNIAHYTHSFDGIDLSAPGIDLISSAPDGKYRKISGISMAVPHVSGACALLADFWHKREGRMPGKGELNASVPHFQAAEGALFKHVKSVNGRSYLFGRGILDLTFIYKRWPLHRVQVGAYYYTGYASRMEQILKNNDFPAYREKY